MSDFTPSSDLDDVIDEEFLAELIDTFILEFEELMDIYREALKNLRNIQDDKLHALNEIFRVFHTLKGDAAYFNEFQEFAAFASDFCDRLRDPKLEMLKDTLLMRDIRLNYSRLSSAFSALNRGSSLRAFRFKIMLRNF